MYLPSCSTLSIMTSNRKAPLRWSLQSSMECLQKSAVPHEGQTTSLCKFSFQAWADIFTNMLNCLADIIGLSAYHNIVRFQWPKKKKTSENKTWFIYHHSVWPKYNKLERRLYAKAGAIKKWYSPFQAKWSVPPTLPLLILRLFRF